MATKKHEVVTYTCDLCGKVIKKSDDLVLIGKHVPVQNKIGSKVRWGALKVDLCADCATRFFTLKVETRRIPSIKDNADEWFNEGE